jgi:hypothetical protein
MNKCLLVAALFLSGCATEPLTPEQALMLMNMQRAQAQPSPLLMYRPSQYVTPPRPVVNCTTYPVGHVLHTTCR